MSHPDLDPDGAEVSEVTQVREVVEPSPRADGDPAPACLIVMYTRSGQQLGQRVSLHPGEPVTLGRDSSADFVIDSERLSRRHCVIETVSQGDEAGWQLRDLDSTNGTFVNGVRVEEHLLAAGDVIEAGGASFRFLVGAQQAEVDEQYRDTLLKMSLEDGLTGLTNQRRLLQVLEAETARARRYGRPLGLIILHVDEFKKVNARYGYHAGDRVLRVLAGRLQAKLRQEDTIGRFGMDTFGVVLPETAGAGIERTAEHLRQAVEAEQVQFDDHRIPATASVGAAELEPDWEVARFVEVTAAAARKAKAGGRNCVYVAPQDPSRSFGEIRVALPPRLLEPRALLYRTLARDVHGPLLGFEIEDEPSVVRLLGTAGLDRWLDELAEDVRAAAPPEALVGRWGRRNVVVALPAERLGEVEAEVRRKVLERFGRREVPAAQKDLLARVLRVAQVGSNVLHEHGEQAFELLAGYLGQPSGGIGDALDTLPFPLVAARAQVAGCPTLYSRVRTLYEGLDVSMRFLVGCQLAWVRDSGDVPDLIEVLRGASSYALQAGATLPWTELCWKLAGLLPEDASDAVCTAARALMLGSSPSPLTERLREAASAPLPKPGQSVQVRALERLEVELRDLLGVLGRAMRSLGGLRLVSVKSIQSVDHGDATSYALRLHRGPLEYFPQVNEDLPSRLRLDSCYLLREPGRRPLLLAPLVFARSCEACARVELFLADSLVLGPERAPVKARSVTRGHEATFELPWTAHIEALYQADLVESERRPDAELETLV